MTEQQMQQKQQAMNWDDIKVFLAVSRAGSLIGAARVIGQTQPTIGRRLKAFETSLGLSLFQRHAHGFLLTDEGAMVLAHAEHMEQEALGFHRRLAGQDGQLEGLVRASSSDWFGVHVLSPVFASFQRRHPGVTVELLTDSRLYDLARREADLVFRIRPFDADDGDVVARRLMHTDYALYGPVGCKRPRNGGKGASLVTMDSAFSNLPDVQWLAQALPHAHVAMRSNNREVQAMLCAAGSGFAVLPCLLGDRFPTLRRVDVGSLPPGRDVHVGYHKDLRRLARLRRLLDHVVGALSDPQASST